jgi:hypothetical protein
MTMNSKTMQFDHITVTYNYLSRTMDVVVNDKPVEGRSIRVDSTAGQMHLSADAIIELKEAFEGIGQQPPGTRRS